MMRRTQVDAASLMREFVRTGSAALFAKLVERYLALVFRAAYRRSNGDRALAEDVCQLVFIDFARRMPALRADDRIGAWLHRAATLQAGNLMRSERRRKQREENAAAMMEIQRLPDPHEERWNELAPALDEALSRCRRSDREILVLRYLEGRKLQAVADLLGITEEAAKKRSARALERLRSKFFSHRLAGLTTAGALGTMLAGHGAKGAVRVGLASEVATVSVAKVASGGTATWLLQHGIQSRWVGLGIAMTLACGSYPIAAQWRELESVAIPATPAKVEPDTPAESPAVKVLTPPAPPPVPSVFGELTVPEIVDRIGQLVAIPPSKLDQQKLRYLLEQIPDGGAAEALSLMEEHWSDVQRRRADQWREHLFIAWSRIDPPTALDWLLEKLKPGSIEYLNRFTWHRYIKQAVRSWAERDWDGAWKFVRTRFDDGRLLPADGKMDIPKQIVFALREQIIERDGLRATIDFVADVQSRSGGAASDSGALSPLISLVKEDDDFRYFLDVAGRLPSAENRTWSRAYALMSWGKENWQAAAEWVRKLPTGMERAKFGWDVGFDEKASAETYAAHADWLMEQDPRPTYRVRRAALERVIYGWMRKNPETASDWLIERGGMGLVGLTQLSYGVRSIQEKKETVSEEWQRGALRLIDYWKENDPKDFDRQLIDFRRRAKKDPKSQAALEVIGL